MKELFIKYFLKLMFLHENIMDKKVQYILLVFVGLWFVCCFLRFTSSIIFSKIIPLIFALCMLVFSVISLISFQWVYWMMWLIMAWGILITEDIHLYRKKEDEMKIWECKCDVLKKQNTDLEISNKLLEKSIQHDKEELKEVKDALEYWYQQAKEYEILLAVSNGYHHSTKSGDDEFKEQIKKLEEERDHFRLLYQRAEWQLNHSKKTNQEVDVFKNCDSLESLSKRKKALLSIFHPDAAYGDNEITRIILEQYNKMKANYS